MHSLKGTDSAHPRWLAALASAAAVFLLGAAVVFVLRNYSIKAWSDPINWLTFARDLRTEFFTNRFACGYPLFLALIEPLTGPYAVFLSNLPLLLAAIAGAGWLAAAALPAEARTARWAAFFVTAALVIAADMPVLFVLVNPYRDALSHALLMAAMLPAARCTHGSRPSAATALTSGLLFGLAYSVREPVLLIAGPIGVFLLLRQRQDPSFGLPRWVAWTAVGAVLGASPLVAQSLLRSGGAGWLPPQSIAENKLLPGLHAVAFSQTGPLVWDYLFDGPVWRWVLVGLWALGLGVAIRTRHLSAGLLLAAPAAIYAVFYSFYWTLVVRYLWIALLFGAATGGWCVATTLHTTTRRWAPRLVAYLPVGVGIAAAIVTASVLLRYRTPELRFRMEDARRLTAAVGDIVPPGAKVLALRHFCEIIRWFNGLDAFPASWHWQADASDPVPSLRTAVLPAFEDSREVWAAEVRTRGRRDVEFAAIRRAFEPVPVATLDLAPFNLGSISVAFWKLQPWSSTRQEWSVYAPQSNMVLTIDAGSLSAPATLRVNEGAATPARSGANFIRLPHPGPYRVVLDSTEPLARLPVRLWPPSEPVQLDFDLSAEPSCQAWLGEGFRRPPYGIAAPAVQAEAVLTLPAAAITPARPHRLRLRMRSTKLDPANFVGLEVHVGGTATSARVPMDRRFHVFETAVWVPRSEGDMDARLVIVDPAPRRGIELETVDIVPMADSTSEP